MRVHATVALWRCRRPVARPATGLAPWAVARYPPPEGGGSGAFTVILRHQTLLMPLVFSATRVALLPISYLRTARQLSCPQRGTACVAPQLSAVPVLLSQPAMSLPPVCACRRSSVLALVHASLHPSMTPALSSTGVSCCLQSFCLFGALTCPHHFAPTLQRCSGSQLPRLSLRM